jgi:hypothetical protein
MKDADEIQNKLEQLKSEHLQLRIKRRTDPHPRNCRHNYKHEEDGESIRLCMLGADNPHEWGGRICDNQETAESCPFFEPRQSEDEIRKEFQSDLQDPEAVNEDMRDVSALRWVLNEDEYHHDVSWWYRIKSKLMG